MTRVTMINSVGEHVAGEEVELFEEEADRFLILGYAKGGDVSRVYTPEEVDAISATHQAVSL